MSDRPVTEMEMTVARALCVAAGEDPDAFTNHSYVEGRPRKTNALCRVKEARAAIQAMRQPTKKMIEHAQYVEGNLPKDTSYGHRTKQKLKWQAMIDAASPPGDKDRG